SFFFSSRRRHTRCLSDWSSDVCSSDLPLTPMRPAWRLERHATGWSYDGDVADGNRVSDRAGALARRRGSSRPAALRRRRRPRGRSEEHTSELQSLRHLVCRLLLEKKNI